MGDLKVLQCERIPMLRELRSIKGHTCSPYETGKNLVSDLRSRVQLLTVRLGIGSGSRVCSRGLGIGSEVGSTSRAWDRH